MRTALLLATSIFLLFAGAVFCDDADLREPTRTGEFQLTARLNEVAGEKTAEVVATVMSPDESITWATYVPAEYRPEKPVGLVVYVSPTSSGKIPRRWKSVMDEENLIWIAANDSGNRVSVARRAVYALVAPTLAKMHYEVDDDRIYLSGLSGGGRVASMFAADYPQLFKGAIYICGVDFWGDDPHPQIDLIQGNHYVFVTGTRDFALEQTKKVHRRYLNSGVENSKLMVVRGMTHENPKKSDFAAAIQFLDSRLAPTASPPTHPGH